jgi:hypothetical protein
MRLLLTQARNFILFVSLLLWRGTPFHLWGKAWRRVQEYHRAEVHKAVWELKCEGLVREDENGLLWAVDKDKEQQK